jgi:8-oxo-dGTP pyrophosphatase MutT (NUDIX family)
VSPLTRDLLRAALTGPLPMPSLGSAIDTRHARAAAVVVPLRLGPEPAVFVVLRGSQLKDHGGEVGFPGGKPEPGDADLAATALRELEEEVGVPASAIELLGQLMPVPVITGRYLIHPFVGALHADATPRIASAEVARVLALPLLPILTGRQPIAAVSGEWNGAKVLAPHFPLDGCVLYGASAYILYELLARLAAKLETELPPLVFEDVAPWGDRYTRSSPR